MSETKRDPRERLAELLGPGSTNFLGTGLTMHEFMQELARIREITEFSTRTAELAIESVIEGDWKMVEEWAGVFAFDDEGEDLRQKYAPIFTTFRELLLQALRVELPA